jgi:hypothetical protein
VTAAASASSAAAQLLKFVCKSAAAAAGAEAPTEGTHAPTPGLLVDLDDIRKLTAVVSTAMQASGDGSQGLGEVLEPAKWAAFLKALAVADTQQQQQQGVGGLLCVDGMQGLVQAASACVQAHPSSTATAASDGPATLVALLQLQLPVEPDWLRHLTANMDTAAATGGAGGAKGAGSKASWYKQAAAAVVLAYLQALAVLQQAPSLVQCDALVNSMAVQSKLQQLQPHELALLLVLLAQGCSAALAASSGSSGPGHRSGHDGKSPLDYVRGVQAVYAAGLPAVLSAVHAGVELPFKVVQGLINATAWLDCDLQELGISSSGSSSKGAKQQAAAAAELLLGCIGLTSASIAATAASSAIGAVTGEGDTQISHGDVTSTLWLLNQVHSCSPVPQAVRAQALAAAQAYLSLQELPLPPGDAARLFSQVGTLALSLTPGLAEYDAIPDPDLGGVLVQLQQDMEADWGHASMTAAELVQLPQLMSKFKLEVERPEQYAAAVYGQLQEMDAAPQAAVTAASHKGRGPMELLFMLCWLLMEGRSGRPGDSTLQGLDQVTAAAHGNDSSSSTSTAGDVQPDPTDVDITPAAAQQLCDLIALAKGVTLPILSSLSGPQVLDLAHVLLMAKAASSQEVALIWAMLVDRLSKPQELAGLTPSQHLALLALLASGVEGGLADNVEARQAAIKSVEVVLKVRGCPALLGCQHHTSHACMQWLQASVEAHHSKQHQTAATSLLLSDIMSWLCVSTAHVSLQPENLLVPSTDLHCLPLHALCPGAACPVCLTAMPVSLAPSLTHVCAGAAGRHCQCNRLAAQVSSNCYNLADVGSDAHSSQHGQACAGQHCAAAHRLQAHCGWHTQLAAPAAAAAAAGCGTTAARFAAKQADQYSWWQHQQQHQQQQQQQQCSQ